LVKLLSSSLKSDTFMRIRESTAHHSCWMFWKNITLRYSLHVVSPNTETRAYLVSSAIWSNQTSCTIVCYTRLRGNLTLPGTIHINSWTVSLNFNYLLGYTNYTAPIDSCSLVPDVILLLTYHAEHWITWKFQHVSVSTSCVQTRSYRRRIGRIIVLENNKMKITRQSTRAIKSQICPALKSATIKVLRSGPLFAKPISPVPIGML